MAGVGSKSTAQRDGSSPPPVAVAAVAARQHGVVTHRQLVAAGYSAAAIQRRVENGHLHRKYKGVYAVGYSVLSTRGCWMAAVLASGADALLSHRDTAELWELRRNGRRSVDVTSPRSRHEHDGITLHRSRHIHPDDRAEVDGIPVTSVARTLLDFADVASQQQVERLVEQAELRELF